jgi:hypothetical protein
MERTDMLDAIKMGRWLGINEQISRAKEEAKSLVTRWDVPQGQRKPGQDKDDKEIYIEAKKGVWAVLAHDMRDIKGRFYRTTPDPITGRQGRVAGRMLVEDLVKGSWSPSIPLLFGLLSILGVLAFELSSTWLLLPLILAMVPVATLISTSTERFTWAAAAVTLCVILPLGMGSLMNSGAAIALPTLQHSGGKNDYLMPVLIAGGILLGVVSLFAGLRAARVFIGSVVGLSVVVLGTSLVPEFFRPMFLALPGSLLPAAWPMYEELRRAKRLALQGKMSFEASSLPLSHVAGRLEQSRRASLDDSPIMVFGHATGLLSAKWDGWAPDEGLPVQFSCRDIATHLLVLGSTGRGKTSSIIRPIVVAWIKSKVGGCLIMDGKGSLAMEFAGLKNYLLIDPAKNVVGLYEGMTAADVARTLREVNVSDNSQGDSRMWNDLAFDMCRHSAVVLEALVQQLDAEKAPRADRSWFWTLHNHQRVAVMGLAGADAIADAPTKDELEAEKAVKTQQQTLKVFLDVLKANHPKGNTGLLAEARHYFLSELPAMPTNVRGSIFTTFSSWLSPITGHELLLVWAQSETGVSPNDCLHGCNVGINLPETKYGRAGAIATAFLKNRVFNEVRQRADGDWRLVDPTAKPALFVMDECQILLSEAEMELSSISRQLGAFFVCCSQTIESIRQTSKNLNKTEAFLDSFQSFIVLKSSPETIDWVSKRLGTTWQPGFSDKGRGIDFVGGASKALGSPLFDPTHPLKRWMKMMVRRGAGGFNDISNLDQGISYAKDLAFELNISAGGWEEKPLLSLADFSTLTHKQGVALVQLMRAGSPRRDFIDLDQVMDHMPVELMDPDYIQPKVQAVKADEVEEEPVLA